MDDADADADANADAPHTQGKCSAPDASDVSNLRRTSGDVQDNWASVTRILSDAAAVAQFSKPGYFGDMDILEIGNGGLSPAEEKTMFTLWSAIKSPLLLGNDLANMSAYTLSVLGNEKLIAVNQDALGVAAKQVLANDDLYGCVTGHVFAHSYLYSVP